MTKRLLSTQDNQLSSHKDLEVIRRKNKEKATTAHQRPESQSHCCAVRKGAACKPVCCGGGQRREHTHTYQDCAEHGGADPLCDLVLSLFIGSCEVVFSSGPKHPERHQQQLHLLQWGSAEAALLFLSHTILPYLLQYNLKHSPGT